MSQAQAAFACLSPAPGQTGTIALGALRLTRLLSAELFADLAGLPQAGAHHVSTLCHDRWTDLARTLAVLPEPLEGYLIVGARPEAGRLWPEVSVAFMAAVRAPTSIEAVANCRRRLTDLWKTATATLDYGEFELVTNPAQLDALIELLSLGRVTEVRRRVEVLRPTVESAERLGFATGNLKSGQDPRDSVVVHHLYPWVPSDDPWRRLLEVMAAEPGPTALVVHFLGWRRAPPSSIGMAREHAAAAEIAVDLPVDRDVLRREALSRLAIVQGDVLAMRVFVGSHGSPSAALLATIQCALDDASIQHGQTGPEPGPEFGLRGGADMAPSGPEQVFASLDAPSLSDLFGPREAGAALRTPMPSNFELPGLPLSRARTAPCVGLPGFETPLGVNVHRGIRAPVGLDLRMRFRHTYVIGQTGTGKSTLLLDMALSDIRAGRGVAVLDPHGQLIEQILRHYPEERVDDLLVVAPSDVDRPVGFNILRIQERDPQRYTLARDIIIDDLYSYLERTYNMPLAGGPVFETHFRGMLGLLLGVAPQDEQTPPNLSLVRLLYTNKLLRKALTARLDGRDSLLVDFVQEAEAGTGESRIENHASYINSKFNRFVSDRALRNMTCQSRTLDFESLVAEKRVLLFDLGRGRFGDQAAGLLASQLISRIKMAVMQRQPDTGPPFFVYADEFQLFADRRFAELLAEGRKFGLSLTLAHQYTAQLPSDVLAGVLGNVGTTMCFRVGPADADVLGPLFAPTFTPRDVSSLANFRACVRGSGELGHAPFTVEIPPPPAGGSTERSNRLKKLSREVHGRDRAEVEAEIETIRRAYIRLGNT